MEKVDILFITWNRVSYAKKTIDNLLANSDDLNIYWWDNGSTDGIVDYIQGIKDKRIVGRYLSSFNQKQAVPTRWFLSCCEAEIIGKVDDDTLVPDGWVSKIIPILRSDRKIGMIGCWTFWLEDFERNRNKAVAKIVDVGDYKVLSNIGIGGTGVLIKKTVALEYIEVSHNGNAFPIDRYKMSSDGYLSGWVYPLLWSEHMDDPRSKYCLSTDMNAAPVALTAVVRGFKTNKHFLDWIMRDADESLITSTTDQLRRYKMKNGIMWRFSQRIVRAISRLVNLKINSK